MARKSMLAKMRRTPKYAIRARSRCRICGRSRGYMRKFDMCRLCFRRLAHEGALPGVVKSSW